MNNDRFKFRVWDGQNYVDNFMPLVINRKGSLICSLNGDVMNTNVFRVEQCTGLKDENGKLIYEGDIITYELGFYSVRAIVKWDDERAVFALDFGRGIPTNYAKVPSGRVNVIGNIHEKEFDK